MAVSAKKRRDDRIRRHRRVRKNVRGSAERPRVAVFRSNKQIYAQIVDDLSGKTLASASSRSIPEAEGVAKADQAKLVGTKIAEASKAAGVENVVFDRNGYLYHGRVKNLADAAREGGLKF